MDLANSHEQFCGISPAQALSRISLEIQSKEIPQKSKPTKMKYQLVYAGPGVQEPIVIPKERTTLRQFEEFLRSTLANDEFCLDPWTTHVFTIETMPDPEPEPKPKRPPESGLPKKPPPPSIFDMEDSEEDEEGKGMFGLFSES